jgi:hypothetical protein
MNKFTCASRAVEIQLDCFVPFALLRVLAMTSGAVIIG